MMTIKDYKDHFIIDGKIDSDGFLKAFAIELMERLSNVKEYHQFNSLIFDMMIKYRIIKGEDILNKTKDELKKPLKDKLWNAFFAIYVVPARRDRFPKEQERIEKKKKYAKSRISN